jgi:hypothetical protein
VWPLKRPIGGYLYISDVEATGFMLLMFAFFLGFGATMAIVPKEFIPPAPGTPRWMTYVSASFKTDLARPDQRLKIVMACSAAVHLAVIIMAGPILARFLVSHGIVLHP